MHTANRIVFRSKRISSLVLTRLSDFVFNLFCGSSGFCPFFRLKMPTNTHFFKNTLKS